MAVTRAGAALQPIAGFASAHKAQWHLQAKPVIEGPALVVISSLHPPPMPALAQTCAFAIPGAVSPNATQ
ncbi:hypothetical protein KNHN1_07850 [Pseudomonas guariconensis]